MDQIPAERIKLHIYGIVQGVGFRPFVARMARRHGIAGTVCNTSGHVEVDATGLPQALARFTRDIQAEKPAGSHIQALRQEALPDQVMASPQGFAIVPSSPGEGVIMPTPDLAICDDCLRELFTPGDSRHRNAFISCTHCGPRFSIMRRVPYDRDNISMDIFPLCPRCQSQYADAEDRRFHAQTVCCNDCGPTLFFGDASGEQSLAQAVHALRGGAIVMVKGIGGYHLACSAFDAGAVSRLRTLKGREAKPFAVMFESLASLACHCALTEKEQALLESPARPIVLLKRKPSSGITPGVYGDSGRLGAFLPYTPLQHLLLKALGPLVMTSANHSAMPILYQDAEALTFFQAHASMLAGVLYHDRPILRRLDDSVAAVVADTPQMIRRARGYVPMAISLPEDYAPPLVALGPQQKNTFCYYQAGKAFLSAENGDLDTCEAEDAYQQALNDMGALLNITPAMAVHDLHPGYATTHIAQGMHLPAMAVQHHHAHIASVMAEHGLAEPVIGVAFDGTGYGTDGAVWGGEFLIVSPEGFTRAGHLKAVTMLGSDDAVRQGWKSAACMLHDAGIPAPQGDARLALVYAALQSDVNTIQSSSMGRLFDAVSALLDICQQSTYDGQGAIALENAAARHLETGACEEVPLPFDLREEDGQLIADFAPCIRALYRRHQAGEDADSLAWQFHITISELIETACLRLSRQQGIRAVALSGGVFHNRLLLSRAITRLRASGLKVYVNEQVPSGDGGIALGQMRVALWEIERRRKA